MQQDIDGDKRSAGKVASESLACGIPVVGLCRHSLGRPVLHRQTGYLAEYKSPDALSGNTLGAAIDE